MIAVAPVNRKNFHKNALPRLKAGAGVHHALITQLTQWNVGLHTEKIDKNAGPNYRYNAPLCTNALIQQIIAIPVCTKIIFSPLGRHCF